MFDVATESELRRLLEKLCEERLDKDGLTRLEAIVLADHEARRYYRNYLQLHGSLHWDAAVNNASDSALTLPRIFAASRLEETSEPTLPAEREPVSPPSRRRLWSSVAAAAAVLLVVGLSVFLTRNRDDGTVEIVEKDPPERIVEERPDPVPRPPAPPLELDIDRRVAVDDPPTRPDPEVSPDAPEEGSTDEVIVAFIDRQLEAGYAGAEVEPSPRADDAEWVRRVYLDLAGHIPPPAAVEEFLADERPHARQRLVQKLLDEPAYPRHFASLWSNLLVGRRPPDDVDRDALQAYLREAFARNRPWSDVVTEIVAAEGAVDENGAANFLVAHVNAEAVPATAITAKLFLGVQVQCTQCHPHPFNDWKQDQFWELNAFFKQTELVERGGRTQLVSTNEGGPTFYDTRQGLKMVAYPRFEGRAVDPAAGTNRRLALAELLVEGDRPQLADAIVNRVWAHFLGRGFTTPVDDMGPHNPPTHPALLARLSREFVKSGYDLRRLVTWVTSSSAYQRTSRIGEGNEVDRPEIGEPPVFSRVYVRPMTPEQVYDSLVVATRGDAIDWDRTLTERDRWIQAFVTPNETDENDETLTLDGTIPQALALMNGELTSEGISLASGTELARIVAKRGSAVEKIRRAFVATLSREPTDREIAALRPRFRAGRGRTAEAESLRDLYWALLNSSEFALVH